ncbi:MAG TPA: chemotaxis protein CheB, partial [Thermomicrobiales bacterium]|nr:chemotaxis protein CheB [Thermomicrobiales bacterium]
MDQTRAEASPQEDPRSSLVVLGSSAGGIDALLTVVGGLPADFTAPVVVAQHLDPHHESRLADLLASRSNLPVHAVTGHAQLEPGTIYVVPTSSDVAITDHTVDLATSGTGRSHPSVDRLMATAAPVFRENLIGVVLTGTGADGTAGAQAVKAYGGTVIVQNPDSARFSGMPASVLQAAIDIVAELDAIAGLLVDLCRGGYAIPPAEDDSEMQVFLDRVREQTGLDFSAYKRPTIERRLQRRMVAAGVGNIGEYQRYVDRNPDEMQRLVASFLIKVTRFFRDAEMYEHLRDRVLPRLLAEAR